MQIRITNGMLIGLIINLVYAKAIGLTQGAMAREVGGDVWIATIFATIQGIIIMYLTTLIIKRQPEKNLSEHASILTGKWGGKLVSLLLFIFFLGSYSTIMITYVYHLMDYFLPEGPILLLIVVAWVVGVFAVYHGLEVIGRMALVGVFSIVALNLLMVIGVFDEFDIRELLPVFQSGFTPTLLASRHNDTDWAMATLMVAMVLPLVKKKDVWSRSGPIGIFYGGILVLAWPILEVGVLSSEVTAEYIVSCMQLARSAEIGMYIHRYEMIMVAFFATSILTQIMMCIFCASLAASQLFGLRDFRPMVLPTSLILSGFGYWVVFDHTRAMVWLEDYWPLFAIPLAFLLPIGIWLLGYMLKKRYQKPLQNKNGS